MPVVTKPYTFSNTPADTNVVDADQFNANFDALFNVFDGNITNDHVDAAAGIEASKLSTAAQAALCPTGVFLPYGGAAAPTGWLLCDGTAVSRATYAALFAAISTSYGSGDGSTTFNLPDLRGRSPLGLGTHTDVDALGESDGEAVGIRSPKHALTSLELPDHTHLAWGTANYNFMVASSPGVTFTTVSANFGSGSATGNLVQASSAAISQTTSGGYPSDYATNGQSHHHGYQVANFIVKT